MNSTGVALLVLAAFSNIAAVALIEKTKGFTVPLPTLTVAVGILSTQYLISEAVKRGVPTGVGVASVVSAVVIASVFVDVGQSGTRPTIAQVVGCVVVAAGACLVNLGGAPK